MNEEQKDEQEFPTTPDIELQIWKIGRYGKNPEIQLEACQFLLERIEARENAGPKLMTVELVKTGEAKRRARPSSGSSKTRGE